MRPVAIANRHAGLRLNRAAVARMIRTLDAHAKKFRDGPPPGELSLVFLPDAALAKLHGDFLRDATPTDVITFAGDPAHYLAGEICVSVDAAVRYVGLPLAGRPRRRLAGTVRPQGPARQDAFSRELTLYVVHGWLHLVGYDDLAPAKKRTMRRAEARAMKLLRDARALPAFTLRRA